MRTGSETTLMARDYARVFTQIWNDNDFRRLSRDAQCLYIQIISQRDITLVGVTTYAPRRWAQGCNDETVASIDDAIIELEHGRFVVVDHETDEVWVRTFVKHDGVLDNPNHTKGMWNALEFVYSETLRNRIVEGLPPVAWDALPKGYSPP